MVSSQLSGLTQTGMCKPFKSQLLLPMDLPDVVPSDYIEFNFPDVFSPAPVQALIEVDLISAGNLLPGSNANKMIYDDLVVIHSQSHSLVSCTNCVCQSLKLGNLALHETEDSLELGEFINGETLKEPSIDEGIIEKPFDHVDNQCAKSQSIGLEDFEVMKVVGQGAFGKVFQVRKKCTMEIYAMKVMRKDKIFKKNHVEYMKAERDILTKTKYKLYLVLDFVNGGHLFFQLCHQGLFREDLARVYTAEIVSAVSHLHANGIMHRDLKLENILLDADGHAMLTDFGLAKQFEENTRSNSMCGTLEYMSPEIILGKGHDKAADWWSVGILLFEMLTGKLPFIGNREKIQEKIIKNKIKLPAFLSSEAHSLLKGLLQKDASKRLGSGPGGSEEIKRHKWFKPINWKRLEAREIYPSFRPEVAGKHCVTNFEEHWTNMPLLDSPVASPTSNDNPFKGFTYVRTAEPFLQRNDSLY